MKIKVIKKSGEVKVVEPKKEPRTWSDITAPIPQVVVIPRKIISQTKNGIIYIKSRLVF